MSDAAVLLGFVGLRLGLLLTCRKFLLRSSLYIDLQRLSAPASSELHSPTTDDGDWIALPTVSPQPVSATPTPTVQAIPLHSNLSCTTFASCFAETLVLVLLLILQTLDGFTPRVRYINWMLSLFLITTILLLFVPLFISIVLTVGSTARTKAKRRSLKFRLGVNVIPVILYIVGFSYIPLPDVLSATDLSTATLSRLITLGTIVLGLLSGFGALNNSWEFLPLRSRSQVLPTEGDIKLAENSLARVRDDLNQLRLQLQDPPSQSGADDRKGTWYSRFIPKLDGDSRLQELKGLEALEYQMSADLDALRRRRQAAIFSATLKGRLYNFGGALFSVYCVVRVISSLVNLISPTRSQQTSYPDLITQGLAYILSLLSADVDLSDVARVSRQISLILVGVIILSSIRLLLRGVTRALRVTNRSLGASLMLLLLAQIMGIYMLSTIVQLRSTFPPPPVGPRVIDQGQDKTSIPTNLFSTIPEYEVFGSLFDWSFLLAAGGTLALRWGADRMNGVS